MKTVQVHFYSYRPRLLVGMIWTTDLIPNVDDEIQIPSKFIYQWDTKYFDEGEKEYSRPFRVKKRLWNVNKHGRMWNGLDLVLTLDWTDYEKNKIAKYIENYQKERGKEKIK